MKKLAYNIYFRKITDEEFIEIRNRLIPLGDRMSEMLLPGGWQISEPSDGMAYDFTKSEPMNHYGNIGLKFDNEGTGTVFTFYVTKSFDVGDVCYFLREDIFKEQPFVFFENNIDAFVKEALKKYRDWTDEQIIELGEQY